MKNIVGFYLHENIDKYNHYSMSMEVEFMEVVMVWVKYRKAR